MTETNARVKIANPFAKAWQHAFIHFFDFRGEMNKKDYFWFFIPLVGGYIVLNFALPLVLTTLNSEAATIVDFIVDMIFTVLLIGLISATSRRLRAAAKSQKNMWWVVPGALAWAIKTILEIVLAVATTGALNSFWRSISDPNSSSSTDAGDYFLFLAVAIIVGIVVIVLDYAFTLLSLIAVIIICLAPDKAPVVEVANGYVAPVVPGNEASDGRLI